MPVVNHLPIFTAPVGAASVLLSRYFLPLLCPPPAGTRRPCDLWQWWGSVWGLPSSPLSWRWPILVPGRSALLPTEMWIRSEPCLPASPVTPSPTWTCRHLAGCAAEAHPHTHTSGCEVPGCSVAFASLHLGCWWSLVLLAHAYTYPQH